MKAEDFFGAEAARHWSLAWDHLHRFAHRSGCLPGDDVVKHFLAQQGALQKALEADRRQPKDGQ